MAEIRRSFHNVKSLLGKLDRSIDEARSKRLGGPDPDEGAPSSGTADGLETVIGRAEGDAGTSADASRSGDAAGGPASSNGTTARRSLYGRAKPLNRGSDASPMSKWSADRPS